MGYLKGEEERRRRVRSISRISSEDVDDPRVSEHFSIPSLSTHGSGFSGSEGGEQVISRIGGLTSRLTGSRGVSCHGVLWTHRRVILRTGPVCSTSTTEMEAGMKIGSDD